MKIKEQKFVWDAQIKENGKWVSIYGPFEDLDDAEDIIEKGIESATKSTAFRILPISVDDSK